jgi:hypothetical protein
MQDFWKKAIQGDYKDLDLREVLAEKRPGESLIDLDKRIRQTNPILHLQLRALYYLGDAKRIQLLGSDRIQRYLDRGGDPVWKVPASPITAYAAKNPEEAFCEALGMMVGYGPRAVLEKVRGWLKIMLPQLKEASLAFRVCQRYLQAKGKTLWDGISAEVGAFNKLYNQVQKWKRLRKPEKIIRSLEAPQGMKILEDIAWGDDKAVPTSAAQNLGKWAIKNKGSDWMRATFWQLRGEVSDSFDSLRVAIKYSKPEELSPLLRLLPPRDPKTLKPLLQAGIKYLDTYKQAIQDLLSEAGPIRFTYKGFKIHNPDRLIDSQLKKILGGVDYTLALFKQRGVEEALREGVKEVSIRLARPSDKTPSGGEAAGWYHSRPRQIEMIADTIMASLSGARLMKDWITEVFLHEFGHHLHMSFLPPDAKAEWDRGWAPVEEAKETREKRITDQVREQTSVTREERQKFFNLVKSQGWNPQKAGRKLKGFERIKFLTWLYKPLLNRIISVPTQVRLTPYGKEMFKFFADPEGTVLRDFPKEYGYTDARRKEERERKTERFLDNLGLNDDFVLQTPNVGETIEKIRSEDRSVEEAISALEVPTGYARTDVREDFAETFVAFIANPGALSDQATFRMQRALSLSGLYGKPVMRLAEDGEAIAQRIAARAGTPEGIPSRSSWRVQSPECGAYLDE